MMRGADAFPAPRSALGAVASGSRSVVLFLCGLLAVLVFAFPVIWLVLTSLRPAWAMFYVYRGTEFTLDNYVTVWERPQIALAFFNSFLIATLSTVASLAVTVTSGYMLSRFSGRIADTWFGTIYVFRTVPYITWVLPLYFVTQWWGLYDTYLGLLLPHIAVHICFFSWIMKGFFDGIESRHGIGGADRRMYALGCVLAGRVAIGDARHRRVVDPVLAVDMERVPFCADSDRQEHADPHGRDGPIRHGSRH